MIASRDGKKSEKIAHTSCIFILALEFTTEEADKAVIKVLAAQVSIAGGRLDLEDTLLDGQEGNIESTATQVENEDIALTLDLLVETVGDGSSSGLVDDTEDVEAGDETGVLGSLALGVVEVRGDSDNGVVDGVTEVGLSGLTHLDEDHGGDLLRGKLLGLTLELNLNDGLAVLVDDPEGEVLHIGLNLGIGELAANQTLGVEDRVLGVHGDLVLGRITDQTLSVSESNERGRRPVTLVVGDDFNSVISEDTHARVRGAEIYTDGGRHDEEV